MGARADTDAELGCEPGRTTSPRIGRGFVTRGVMPTTLFVVAAAVVRVVDAGVNGHSRSELPGDGKPMRQPTDQLAGAAVEVQRVERAAERVMVWNFLHADLATPVPAIAQ